MLVNGANSLVGITTVLIIGFSTGGGKLDSNSSDRDCYTKWSNLKIGLGTYSSLCLVDSSFDVGTTRIDGLEVYLNAF